MSMEDITESRLRIDELAAFRRSLIVAEFSIDGTFLDANDKLYRTFGYGDLIGRHHSILVDRDLASSDAYASFWHDLGQGKSHQHLQAYRDHAGHDVWVEFTYTALLDALGRCYRVVAAGTDVTRQKIQSAEQDGQIDAIHKSMAVCEFGLDGIILDANDNFLKAFGYRLNEIKGRHHSIFVTSDFAGSAEYATFWQNLRKGYYQAARYQRIGKGNRDVWIEASYNPILDAHGSAYKIVKLATDITTRKLDEDARQAEITHAATHDGLTGLWNRAAMRSFLAKHLAEIKQGSVVIVMLLDLDGFKAVNDTLGHGIGDAVLIEVANRIAKLVKPNDLVARWGGDEFAVCVATDDFDPFLFERRCEQLLREIGKPIKVSGHLVTVGASIGVAKCDTPDVNVDDVLRDADIALYHVKENGRRDYRIFDAELLKTVDERRRLEADLEFAIRNGELSVIYQPVLDVRLDEIVGVETLCRWTHPILGAIPPSTFIPIAEQIGLIGDLGLLVIDQALTAIDDWPEDFTVAINLSPKQIESRDFLVRLDAMMASHGAAAHRIEFEVTETVLLGSDASSLYVLHALRDRGFQIALDDFGTGYSSLSYLKLFPFHRIKVDRSFVCDISLNAQSSAIVAAVTNLAHALDMKVTAEGIETKEQYEMIRAAGCDAAQGYYFGKSVMPMATSAREARRSAIG